MRKTLLLLFSVVLPAALVTGCHDEKGEPDPFDVPAEPGTEKNVTLFELDGQLGEATITYDEENDAAGRIDVLIDIDAVSLDAVRVELLSIPDAATASLKKGDLLDFKAGVPSFTVTAEDGSTRVYSVHYTIPSEYNLTTPFAFRLDGQEGDSVIEDDPADDKGTIRVEFLSRHLDFANIEVTELELPYGATATIQQGEAIDISDLGGTFDFTVTALSGLERVYTVNYTVPDPSTDNSILSIAFAGQMQFGVENNPADNARGTVTVTFPTGTDVSDVEMQVIEVSDYATADKTPGARFDFTAPGNTVSVTAESGAVRTYYIEVDFQGELDPLAGGYVMSPRTIDSDMPSPVVIEGGIDGNAIFLTLMDKHWSWQGGETNLNRVGDYSLRFFQTSIDPSTAEGTVTLTPGRYGYTEFVWGDGTDVSDMYEIIPQGTTRWVKDRSTGKVTFYDGSTPLGSCTVLAPGTTLMADTGNTLDIGADEYAFNREFDRGGWWNGDPDEYWNDNSRYIHNCRRVMWIVKKTD